MRALQRLRAVLLTAEQAKLLKAQERDAGLLVARVGYLKDGRAVEFSQSYYRGEIYDFVAELSASIVNGPVADVPGGCAGAARGERAARRRTRRCCASSARGCARSRLAPW